MAELLAQAERLYAVLRDFPADGQLRADDQRNIGTDLICAGYIEHRETKKRCPTCGTERFDNGWYQITAGGKLFMAAMEANPTSNTSHDGASDD